MSSESISPSLSTVSTDSALHLAQHNNGELSEDELEAVAGGLRGGIGSIPKPPPSGPGPGGHQVPIDPIVGSNPILTDLI